MLLGFILWAFPGQGQAESASLRHQIESAIAQVKPALVQIHVIQTVYSGGREFKTESTGSGTIITAAGHIVTNHHVAGHATRIFCILLNKEKLEAEWIGSDPLSDLTVLKLKSTEGRSFPFARFGESASVQVGDRVLAMGSPVSLSQSVTLGIVSNIGMTLPLLLKKGAYRFILDGEDVGAYVLWIGHDAAIYQGNSGGPLVDLAGRIIGINEIGIGLGGAIPSDLAAPIVDQLIEKGYITRSWTGWEIQPLLHEDKNAQGVLLSGTAKNSPAEKAGFESGDILIRVNSLPVSVKNPEELPLFNRMEAELPIDQKVPVEIMRNHRKMELTIIPMEREAARSRTVEAKTWGITVQNISGPAARELKRASLDGVLVTSVRPGGPGGEAKPSLNAGDILLRVNELPLKSVQDLLNATQKLSVGHNEPFPVLVEFDRSSERLISVVQIGTRDISDPGLEVKKAWLPVATQVITREMARSLGIPNRTGVRITQVYEGSTAETAGLAVGDLILKIDDEAIPAAHVEDYEVFQSMLRQYAVGAFVTLNILRDGRELSIPVQLVRAPQLPREMSKYHDRHFEFTARDLSFYDLAASKLPKDRSGVLVEEVTPGSWAALGQLAAGDIIVAVDGKDIRDVNTLDGKMKEIQQAQPDSCVFHILRGVHHIFLQLEIKW